MITFKLCLICFITALPMLSSKNPKEIATKLEQVNKNVPEYTENKLRESIPEKQQVAFNSNEQTAHMESRRFSDPVNIKDPNFQKLLDEYRDMVHKYRKPPNQGVGNIEKHKRVRAELFRANNNATEQNVRENTSNSFQENPFKVTSATEILERRIKRIGLIKEYRPKWAQGAVRQGPGGPGGGMGGMPSGGGGMPGGGMGGRPGGGMGGPPGGGPGPPGGQGAPGDKPVYPNRPNLSEQGPGQQQPNKPPGEPGQTPLPNQELTMPGSGAKNVAANAASRFTTRTTTTKRRRRTTPPRVSFEENCDYVAYYCLKAYDTGQICGRTMYNVYSTFKNYCMLDFVNCMERYEVWQIAHMGECFELKVLTEYLHYPYLDDYFLDQYYVLEDM